MPSLRKASIARKLTRMNMLVSAAALLLACAGFVSYDLVTFWQTLVRNLSVQAQVTGSDSVSALIFNDREVAQRNLSAFASAPDIASACIYNAQGLPFAFYRRDPLAQIPPAPRIAPGHAENYWFDHRNVMLVHAIEFQGRPVGFVFISSDIQILIGRLERYLIIAGIVLALSLLAALFLSRLVRRSVAEPVVNLARVARRVSRDKNYSLRAARGIEQGELAELVTTFNEMLGQIEERDRSVQAARDELEQRVQQRTEELEAANRELEAFSYSVSHDLRAPLRSLDGFSQALAEDYSAQLDAEGKSHIARIRAAAQRMGLLIDDLLNLSRVTRSEMRREVVDLSGIAHAVAADLGKAGEAREVDWIIAGGMEVSGDSRLLRVVMENLLGNAWKYTSSHPRARIEFGRMQHNGGFAYFVRDDGAGFDPAYSQRLFGAFQRLHGATEFPGTGVGLATVQRIIRRHGGDVWAEGAVEKGATFYFSI